MANYQKIKRFLYLLCFCIGTSWYIVLKYYYDNVEITYYNAKSHLACVLPENLNPFDPGVMGFIWDVSPIKCANWPSLVYVDSQGLLQKNNTAMFNYAKSRDLACTYQIVTRKKGDMEVIMESEVTFTSGDYVPSDFFYVVCKSADGKIVYSNMHHSINNRNTLRKKKMINYEEEKFNIFIYGIDAVSRLHAERKLKKTMKYLKNNIGAYIFEGYTKIGGNTFPNIAPLLTGKAIYELPSTKDFLDDFPFLWKNFSKRGYATFHAEDWPEISTFNSGLKGFNEQPVDHYIRPMFLAFDKVSFYKNKLDQAHMYLADKGIRIGNQGGLCFGNKPKFRIIIDYYKQFIERYGDRLKFGLSWNNELCHDYLNNLQLGDDDIFQFVHWMHTTGRLNNSVFIFLSDHGYLMNEIQNTFVGRFEARMPLLAISIPPVLKDRYPHIHDNLLKNTKRLITVYDIHEFLKNVLLSNFLPKKNKFTNVLPRGISLFQEIPKTRSCKSAYIPEHFCPCYSSQEVEASDPTVREMALFITSRLNKKLQHLVPKCAELKLKKVNNASVVDSNLVKTPSRFTLRNLMYRSDIDGRLQQRFIISLTTIPGNAKFESTVERDDSGHMTILDDVITRTNMYKNQSSCIKERLMKPFCYCSSQ
ncbi:uncharacterized protein LOC133194062 [Saccostrea echinata]|uniref:uncharacterized protein LOC133194062 n=1 Tax=Saccostrea echinata TaxID=191078 RepID=UPI002A7FE683|nr:uncharacterized protein LOC133194062 [Saccostrea echinata]